MHNKAFLIIIIIIIAISAICIYFFLNEYFEAQEDIAEYNELSQLYTSVTYDEVGEDKLINMDIYPPPLADIDFKSLLEINKDTVGWIKIPNTIIDYPVLQCDDNQTYLKRSFYGEYSSTGAVFVDCENTLYPLNENTIVYAHNMGKGRTDMFGCLLDYKDEEFYPNHKYIQFDTVLRDYGYWEIFSVLHISTQDKNFKYLTNKFNNNEEFSVWLNKAKNLSLYNTGVDVDSSDRILTLSTCDRSDFGQTGRLVIMAKLMDKSKLNQVMI